MITTVPPQPQLTIAVPKSYILLGFVGFYFILIFLNIGGIGQLLSNIAGLVIPGYYSLLALETPGKADDTQYLTYWVVFATLNVFEFWSKAILYWVPFYYLFKTAFLLYIGLPSTEVPSLSTRPLSSPSLRSLSTSSLTADLPTLSRPRPSLLSMLLRATSPRVTPLVFLTKPK